MSKNKPKRQPTGEYDVGYCKPPVATQFQPGESGRTRARSETSKRPLTPVEKFEAAMSRKVVVPVDGKAMKLELYEVMLMTMSNAAAKGDRHARRDAIELMKLSGSFEAQESEELSAADFDEAYDFLEKQKTH